MENQLEELKEALEVEKSARARAEKCGRELSKDLESLRSELDMRQKREPDFAALKKSIKEEAFGREVAMSQLKQKHMQLVKELNERLETKKKGKALLEKAKNNLEEDNFDLRMDVDELTTWKTKAEHKVKGLEDQLAETNARLADNQVKMQKELEETNALVKELECNCSDVERVNASPESQLADMQIQEMSVPAVSINSTQEATNRKDPATESGAHIRNDESSERKVHKCTVCNKSFEKAFKCTQCHRSFRQAAGLLYHQRVHSGEKPFQCSQCQKCFRQSSNLRRHELIHSDKKPFKCTQCQKCFRHASGLQFHERMHSGERPYKCTQCPKCFRQASGLQRHKRTHSGEKPYQCTQCQKCFRRASGLQRHKRIHTGEKPYQCTQCEKCFSQFSSLQSHLQVHGSERPFQCTQCQKCFKQSSGLLSHKRIHREKPFKCTHCRKGFRRAWYLRKHQKVVHGDELQITVV